MAGSRPLRDPGGRAPNPFERYGPRLRSIGDELLTVNYTEREGKLGALSIRIISARRAEPHERRKYAESHGARHHG
ncbi:MAG: BrnT family toxin [Candidatus Eremiobacteraeota bacterium]|nr:BrnT family toxin [Candidatus Eremiobacteraeota bacterium]MBC5803793.1 BrnT family toxin [Candidatus Eremiobacteraeota bacterium]MBC5825848.1 BrnT family toxin [Candidatus Eremiobacteraeota bacterium]